MLILKKLIVGERIWRAIKFERNINSAIEKDLQGHVSGCVGKIPRVRQMLIILKIPMNRLYDGKDEDTIQES